MQPKLHTLAVFLAVTACACNANKEQRRKALIEARTIQPIVERWRAEHSGQCPDVQRLRASNDIVTANVEDPWGSLYQINCIGDRTIVMSLGPDRKAKTDDDIIANGDLPK